FFQAEDGIRDRNVTGVQTCALPIYTDIDFSLLLYILMFLFMFAVISYIVSRVIAAISGVKEEHKVLFTNSSLFYNAGNYGVPVNELWCKSEPVGFCVQGMVVVIQRFIECSY